MRKHQPQSASLELKEILKDLAIARAGVMPSVMPVTEEFIKGYRRATADIWRQIFDRYQDLSRRGAGDKLLEELRADPNTWFHKPDPD